MSNSTISRRQFIEGVGALTAGVAAAQLPGFSLASSARAETTVPQGGAQIAAKGGLQSGYNILFVFTDQERFFPKLPPGLTLPAHERLAKTGVTFLNHYCPATMCTSSRSVMLTGLQTANNGMYENIDAKWVKSMSPDIPTIGHMLRKAGYYTAYKGKWHLSRDFEVKEMDRLLTKEMEKYGFADYFSPGDVVGHTLGGYHFDNLIADTAVAWMRRNGRPLNDAGKPWSLFVSLVNPHDIMYFDTDAPGQPVQDTGKLFMHAARAPEHKLFEPTWDMPVPKSFTEPFDAPGRPGAHREFNEAWGYILGQVPHEEERWRRFNDYYINCIRAVDLQVARIFDELDQLGLADRTIIVFTADHGEMAGAHGLRGKGPFAYEETLHLPFYVVHPDVQGGRECRALTSHIDIVPSLLALAGVDGSKTTEIAGRQLPGKSIAPALGNPGAAEIHAVRESVLFTYSGLAMNDGGMWRTIAEAKAAGKNPAVAMVKAGYLPNLKKRGTVRTAFDGRYKLTRYFSPLDHNQPRDLEELYKHNDVELFDVPQDPAEANNLALDKDANRELIATMNEKLNAVIKAEIGVDNGHELPNIPMVNWEVDRVDG